MKPAYLQADVRVVLFSADDILRTSLETDNEGEWDKNPKFFPAKTN